jgi:hypothetical protein
MEGNRLEGWKDGREQTGRMEGWKGTDWKDGRMEKILGRQPILPLFHSFSLPFFSSSF